MQIPKLHKYRIIDFLIKFTILCLLLVIFYINSAKAFSVDYYFLCFIPLLIIGFFICFIIPILFIVAIIKHFLKETKYCKFIKIPKLHKFYTTDFTIKFLIITSPFQIYTILSSFSIFYVLIDFTYLWLLSLTISFFSIYLIIPILLIAIPIEHFLRKFKKTWNYNSVTISKNSLNKIIIIICILQILINSYWLYDEYDSFFRPLID